MTYRIPANLLKAVAIAASTDQARRNLHGVYIEPRDGELRLTATNGHFAIMARVEDPEAVAGQAFIVPSALIAQMKVAKRGEQVATIATDGPNVTLSLDGATFAMPPIDGTFPDYRRVIPTKFNGAPAQFNPDLLAALKKAAKLAGMPGEALAVTPNGENPTLVRMSSDGSLFGVVMPMRFAHAPQLDAAPEWVRS